MISINQFLFIISNYILGMFFTPILFNELPNRMKCMIFPFVGVGILGLCAGIIYVSGFRMSKVSLLLTILLIWLVVGQITQKGRYLEKVRGSVFSIGKIIFTRENACIFFLFVLFTLFFLALGIGRAMPDSTQFEGVGRLLAQGGNINNPVRELPFLLSGRLLIVGAMHAVNRVFGGYSLYALNPIISYWFLLFLSVFLSRMITFPSKAIKIAILLFFIVCLGLNKNYLNASFFIHSNAFAMVYYGLAIIGLYIYAISRERMWIYFGSFMLGVAALTRVDMLIFSLIYFATFAKIIDDDIALWRNAWLIFLVISMPWRFITLPYIPGHYWYTGSYSILFLLLCNMAFGIISTCLLHIKKNIHWIPKAGLVVSVVLLLFLIIFMPSKFHLGWKLFLGHILFGKAWLATAISLIILVPVSIIMVKKRIDINFDILVIPIIFYLFALFFLVAFYGYEKEDHSAMRMMYHIFPVVVFSLFTGLIDMLNKYHTSSSLPLRSHAFSGCRDSFPDEKENRTLPA